MTPKPGQPSEPTILTGLPEAPTFRNPDDKREFQQFWSKVHDVLRAFEDRVNDRISKLEV
mgnify:CR=1 FL=1